MLLRCRVYLKGRGFHENWQTSGDMIISFSTFFFKCNLQNSVLPFFFSILFLKKKKGGGGEEAIFLHIFVIACNNQKGQDVPVECFSSHVFWGHKLSFWQTLCAGTPCSL